MVDRRREGAGAVLGDRRLRLLTVALPALLAGSFEFVRHGLQEFTGLPNDAGNLITAGLALAGALVYFHTVSSLVARLAADAQRAETDRLVLAQRQAIAEELHDSLSQTFFFLNVRLRKIVERLRAASGGAGREAAGIAAEVAEVAGTAEEAYLQLRGTIRRLNATGEGRADGADAAGTLDRLVAGVLAGSDLHSLVESDGTPPELEPGVWAAVQAILLEALRNVRKHASATRVRVWLRDEVQGGAAGVEDDGCGFDPGGAAGFGLASMRRRAAAAGLDLDVESARGRGTRIRVAWPAVEAAASHGGRQGGDGQPWPTTGS